MQSKIYKCIKLGGGGACFWGGEGGMWCMLWRGRGARSGGGLGEGGAGEEERVAGDLGGCWQQSGAGEAEGGGCSFSAWNC